jgi:hypothetical protein
MAESGHQKMMIIVGLVLIVLIGVLLVALLMMRDQIRGGVKEGVQSAAEKKIDEGADKLGGTIRSILQGGAPVTEESLAYERELVFSMTPTRISPDVVEVAGTVRNTGDRKVTFLKVSIVLLDTSGTQVAGRTDYFAHTLPVGDNTSPILPRGSVRVQSTVADGGRWTGGTVRIDVQKIALEE